MIKENKSLINIKSIKAERDFLVKNKFEFKMKLSNYTTEIVVPGFPEFDKKYISKQQGNGAFSGYSKILADIQNWSANENPNIKPETVGYFGFNYKEFAQIDRNPDGFKYEKLSKVFGFDLNAAYATVLFRDYFISKETFEFILGLKKEERLAAVGMLAGKKDVFHYSGGELIGSTKEVSETEGYFYHCVNETKKCMDEIEFELKGEFILSWVDCVFFYNSPWNVPTVSDIIKKHGFEFKQENLSEFKIELKPDVYFISYKKDNKLKFLNIPRNYGHLKSYLLKSLNLI